METTFFHSGFFSLAVIPILIFLARVTDVSIGTVRIIVVSRGIRVLAAVLGFFEVMLWLLAIRQIMQNLNNPFNYIAYAAGFAMGNFTGISIERRLLVSNVMVRVITRKDSSALISFLRGQGYGVTAVDAQGMEGSVKIIFTVVNRKNLSEIVGMVNKFNPNAFYTIEEMKFAAERGLLPAETLPRDFFRRFHSFIVKKK